MATAGDTVELLEAVRSTAPDIAIIDIRMPPGYTDEGLVAASTLRRLHPRLGVLLLSHYVEPAYAMRLLSEQPERSGHFLKERVFDIAVLVDAIRRIHEGETVVDPTIVAALLGRRRRDDPVAGLTLAVESRSHGRPGTWSSTSTSCSRRSATVRST